MKSVIIALAIFGCAVATSVDQTAQVLRNDFEQTPEGNFQFAYETENGISGQAAGVQKVFNKDEVAQEVSGSYQFKTPEGELVQISYVADENGFRPTGTHLPTPPPPQPIPEYIAKSLAWIAAHPYVEKKY